MQNYDFKIVYKKGKISKDADALSRHPEPDPFEDGLEDEFVIGGAEDPFEVPLSELVDEGEFLETLKNEQRKDDNLKDIITKLTSETNKLNPDLVWEERTCKIINDILYVIEKDKVDKITRAKVVVPKTLIQKFLEKSHGAPESGHPGEKRTFDRINKIAFWPGFRTDIYNKVRTCPECQAARPNLKAKMVPIKPQKAQFPLHVVPADLSKLFPPSKGFQYVLVFEDVFSKYCVLFPLAGKNTVGVAKCFTSFVTRFGAPVTWSTDNGGEFKSRLIEAICASYGTKKNF